MEPHCTFAIYIVFLTIKLFSYDLVISVIYDLSVGSYTNYTIQLREDEMLKKSLLATCDERASQPYIIVLFFAR